MARSDNAARAAILTQLVTCGPGGLSPEQRARLLLSMCVDNVQMAGPVTTELFAHFERMDAGLKEAQGHVTDLREKMEQLLGKTWFPALFVEFLGDPGQRNALVSMGSAMRVVGVWQEVAIASLTKGCEVLLNHDLTAIVSKSPRNYRQTGQIATVIDKTDHGTLILKSQEQDVEVEIAEALRDCPLKVGDKVRWDPSACLALQRVEQPDDNRFLLGEVPNLPLSAIGGQDENLNMLLSVLSAVLVSPDKAAEYEVNAGCGMLLVGKPGCGKTLLVRVGVSELARRSGRTAKFFVVKPSEWENPYVGMTEANIRALFANLRSAAEDGSLVVLFLDEVDSIGRVRGNTLQPHSDRALNAVLAELDGFTGREGIAVIATTNRKDLIDSALLQRLTDHEIHVKPPDANGARAIFNIYLKPTLPYSPNGPVASATRQEIIETAIARIYHPNSQYAQLLSVKFRDGKSRIIAARDFACGRLFSQICAAAKLSAHQRDLNEGQRGLTVFDMEEAIAAAMERLASNVTIHNVRNQLPELPTEVDVIQVEPLLRKVARPHKYLNPPTAPQGEQR